VSHPTNLLRLNVGFIIHQTIGYSRDFPLGAPQLSIPPDLSIKDFAGVVRVTRTAQGLLVQGKAHGIVQSECVRCLEAVEQPLEVEFTELYAFTAASVTESGLFVPENGQLELAPVIREEMLVAIPMSSLCRPDCRGLCPLCGENLNQSPVHSHQDDEIDPRLSALKSLLQED